MLDRGSQEPKDYSNLKGEMLKFEPGLRNRRGMRCVRTDVSIVNYVICQNIFGDVFKLLEILGSSNFPQRIGEEYHRRKI